MKISEFKKHLNEIESIQFIQPNGKFVPNHFHITEAGLNTRHFIDCGGTIRTEKNIHFHVWVANDTYHRLEPQKLQKIISIAEPLFGNENAEVEIEYQSETIGRYGVEFDGVNFILTNKFTDCLAKDNCGVPAEKTKVRLSELTAQKSSCCTPGGGCCS